jgi:hypothetical protein
MNPYYVSTLTDGTIQINVPYRGKVLTGKVPVQFRVPSELNAWLATEEAKDFVQRMVERDDAAPVADRPGLAVRRQAMAKAGSH